MRDDRTFRRDGLHSDSSREEDAAKRDRGLIALANDYQSTKLAGGDVVAGKDHVFAARRRDEEKGANEDR